MFPSSSACSRSWRKSRRNDNCGSLSLTAFAIAVIEVIPRFRPNSTISSRLIAGNASLSPDLPTLMEAVLQAAEEFVEFVGGVEIGFEFAGAEAFAKIIEAAGKQVERDGEHFAIGEDDIAPGAVRASRQT